MYTFRKFISCIALMAIAIFSHNSAMAKGSTLKFSSEVVSVSTSAEDEGIVTISIHGVDIPVIVNGDTEIEADGEEIAIGDISAGDFVKVSSFFATEGLVADEISILDERAQQFRLSGIITSVDSLDDSTTVVLLGVSVNMDSDTSITRRGDGRGNSVPASELRVGDEVNIRGGLEAGVLLANRVHVGSREQGNIELEGEVTATSGSGFTLALDGGGAVDVVVDTDTSVSGEIAIGVFVEVEGQLIADLSLVASEVVVDVDGDGDADDDNRRGKRGDHANNGNGRGNGNNADGDNVEIGSEITLSSDTTEIKGKAETKYVEEGDAVKQEFEIEIDSALAGEVFSVVLFFGDISVNLGTITADDLGVAEAEYETGEDDPLFDLNSLLPDGKDVRDITEVQLLQDGSVILEGSFTI